MGDIENGGVEEGREGGSRYLHSTKAEKQRSLIHKKTDAHFPNSDIKLFYEAFHNAYGKLNDELCNHFLKATSIKMHLLY